MESEFVMLSAYLARLDCLGARAVRASEVVRSRPGNRSAVAGRGHKRSDTRREAGAAVGAHVQCRFRRVETKCLHACRHAPRLRMTLALKIWRSARSCEGCRTP